MIENLRARPVSPLGLCALCICLIGLINGLSTNPGPWSRALVRPDWHPPTWAFGPIWATVGVFVALAVAKASDALTGRTFRTFLAIAALNAVLNVSWSALFFTARRPDFAFADIVALWLSIAVAIAFLLHHGARSASLHLLPYLGWVTVATALNFEIVRLNAPF